jgi:hypothetical protein
MLKKLTIMPFTIMIIYSVLLFIRLDNLIKAIKSNKNIVSEILTTLLSILIAVSCYLYIARRN